MSAGPAGAWSAATTDARSARSSRGKDHLGRTLYAEGESTGCVLRWPGCFGDYMVFICQMRWSLDGHEAALGEVQDYMMFRTYRRFMQESRSLAAVRP